MKVLAFILFNIFGPFFICAELDSHGGILKYFSVILTIIIVVMTNKMLLGFTRKRF